MVRKIGDGKKMLVPLLAAAASMFVIAAIVVNQGYLAPSFFLGITATDFGLLALLFGALAVILYLW